MRDPQQLKGRLSHAPPLTEQQSAQFETFWSLYPKKTRLPAAERAWSVIDPTDLEVEQILRRVEWRAATSSVSLAEPVVVGNRVRDARESCT